MGKIRDTYGDCCRNCEIRIKKNFHACVVCLTDTLFQIDDSVCPDCLKPIPPHHSYRNCYDCGQLIWYNRYQLDGLHAITYNINRDLGIVLRSYKGSTFKQKAYMEFPLQALVRTYLRKHWDCLSGIIGGIRDIKAIATVPTRPEILLSEAPKSIKELIIPGVIKEINKHPRYSTNEGDRKYDTTRYKVPNELVNRIRGKNVLLFDDVYVSGSTIHSAAYALREAGATGIIGLIVARQVGKENAEHLLAAQQKRPFDIEKCDICGRY